MKVIFLDFDGVLNNQAWMDHLKEKWNITPEQLSMFKRDAIELDPSRVKMMSDFAKQSNAKIVISSSWRIHHSLDELQEFLRSNGMDEEVLPFDITPITVKQHRGTEVNFWLGSHPECTHYVIFDDSTDFFPNQPLVLTTWDGGLCEGHIDIARGILNT